MIARSLVVSTAREMLGTPYQHQARAPGIGLDCIGLLSCTCDKLNITHGDLGAYSRIPDGKTIIAQFDKYLIKREAAHEGDVLVFWFTDAKLPGHCGIMTKIPGTDRDGVIHTYSSAGRVVEHDLSGIWLKRIHAAYGFPGVV